MKVITTHVKREYADHTAQQTSWQNLPEFPSASEIIPDDRTDVPDLPANPIDRAWNCKEKYVSTHYKLLREDGISPLREAVMEFRQSPSMHDDRDLCVYTQVSPCADSLLPINKHRCISSAIHSETGVRLHELNSPTRGPHVGYHGRSLSACNKALWWLFVRPATTSRPNAM